MRSDPQVGARLAGRSDPSPENGASAPTSPYSGSWGSGSAQDYYQSSLSGHERNHLFLSRQGKRFVDLSALSGLDHPGDSRSFALLDFDRDGWLDVAMVNVNAPFLQLFRNRIGDLSGLPASRDSARVLALRFVGANRAAKPAPGLSARDGYGASVTVDLGEREVLREHRAGEGLAAQNSATMLIGLGAAREVRALTVRWPSGRVHETAGVPAGTVVTAYEDPAMSPTGEAFTAAAYRRPRAPPPARDEPTADRLLLSLPAPQGALRLTPPASEARLRMFTTVATWCEACRREMPQQRLLRSTFDPRNLEMFGVPVDESEGREKLEAYVAEHAPPYRMLLDLGPEAVAEVKARVLAALYQEAIPSTLVTDRDGRVLYLEGGVPTVSDLRRLLAQLQSGAPSRRTAATTAGRRSKPLE